MKEYRLLAVVAIIGFAVIQPGNTLKCYQCKGKDCKNLTSSMIQECKIVIPTTTLPPSSTPAPPSSSSSSPAPPSSSSSSPAPPSSSSSSPAPPSSSSSSPAPPSSSSSSPAPPSSSSSSPAPPSSSSSSPAPPSSSSSSPAPPSSSSSSPAPPSSSSSSPAPPSSSSSSPAPPSSSSSSEPETDDPAGTERRRRSVLGRFPVGQPYDDANPEFVCAVANRGEETEMRGCVPKDVRCANLTKTCEICDSDECNSATSHGAFTLMILCSLVILIFAR